MKDKLEAIRKAVIAANPNKWDESEACGGNWVCGFVDVLISTFPRDIAVDNEGFFYDYSTNHLIGPKAQWNLRRDNLEEQSDECISFLYELLKPSV